MISEYCEPSLINILQRQSVYATCVSDMWISRGRHTAGACALDLLSATQQVIWIRSSATAFGFTPYLTENTGSVITDQSNTRTLVLPSNASYSNQTLISLTDRSPGSHIKVHEYLSKGSRVECRAET
jgi:hypothetical protein